MLETSHPRTNAALRRLQDAMRAIEADIEQHHGVYPFNHGRVTQSELCRRADVKKATLQTPLHKDTTRVEVQQWLDALNDRLMQTRSENRERVTAVADDLSVRLREAEQRVALLEQENAALRALIGRS